VRPGAPTASHATGTLKTQAPFPISINSVARRPCHSVPLPPLHHRRHRLLRQGLHCRTFLRLLLMHAQHRMRSMKPRIRPTFASTDTTTSASWGLRIGDWSSPEMNTSTSSSGVGSCATGSSGAIRWCSGFCSASTLLQRPSGANFLLNRPVAQPEGIPKPHLPGNNRRSQHPHDS